MSGPASLTAVSVEDHGNRVRVEASGHRGGKYFTAWDKNAAAARQLSPGSTFTATIVEKPNPKGKYPHLNLEDIRISGVATLADVPKKTTILKVPFPTGDGGTEIVDLPF